MQVMPAGMHPFTIYPERFRRVLAQGQGVHIRPQQNAASRGFPHQRGHAMISYIRWLITHFTQAPFNVICRLIQLVPSSGCWCSHRRSGDQILFQLISPLQKYVHRRILLSVQRFPPEPFQYRARFVGRPTALSALTITKFLVTRKHE